MNNSSMQIKLSAYSGKIQTGLDGCYVGNQKIECPKGGSSLFNQQFMQNSTKDSWSKDLLPENMMRDGRNDPLFISFFIITILIFALLAVFKLKLFGKTLREYTKPIWPYILISVLIVFVQYAIALPYGDENGIILRITQIIWELMVALSIYKLVKDYDFGTRHAILLGIIYSFIIHGLKVSIRYFFYGKTIFYIIDRFLYGSLLVMIIAVGLGILLPWFKKMGLMKTKSLVIPK